MQKLDLDPLVAGAVLWAALAMPCAASSPTAFGDAAAQFSVSPQIESASGPLDPFHVLIGLHGQSSPRDAVGTGRLALGKGLQLVSGTLLHKAHVSDTWDGEQDELWSVYLRATRLGTTELRASLTVEITGGRRDESVTLLPIVVDSTGVRAGVARPVRKETVRGGQRFRYSTFLVPISGPEDVTPGDIVEAARVLHEEEALCGTCKEGEVVFVVFLNADGTIHSYRRSPLEMNAVPNEAVRAAEAALRKWKFSPARTESRAVADWTFARVKLGP